MSIPITQGTGASSVAAEIISGLNYQQIKVIGGETGSTSVWGITPDGAAKVSVLGTVNISGSVVGYQGGTQITSIVSTVPSSVIVGASIFGLAPVNVTNTNINVSGSVIGFQGGAWSTSIVGAPVFAEDAGHTSGDKGIFVLGVRNDVMSSITSADQDYSPHVVGPIGETIVANAPITKWVQGIADLRVVLGASVTAIAAQGASVFTYITGVQVANMGSASVLVTLAGGLGSILGYTIAPAGGGSNIYYPNALKTGENSAFTASISGTASVLVSAQGFISKT